MKKPFEEIVITMKIKEIENQIERIKLLVPEGNESKEFIMEALLTLLKMENPASMGIISINNTREFQRRITSSLETAKNINNPSKIAQIPEGVVALYTIEWILRPALPLTNGKIENLKDGIWKDIETDILETQSKSICRIDLSYIGHLGTGFIAGENNEHYIILTNAHVIETALSNYWQRDKFLRLKCGFDVEIDNSESAFYELADNYFIHDVYDLGMLYLPKENIEYSPFVLNLNSEQIFDFENFKIGVIGHPSFDSNKDPFPRIFGFGDQFGIKRLSLGFIKELGKREWRNKNINLLLHDCTTLSGSSGSCVIDLKTKNVIGLHFGGWNHSTKKINTREGDVLATLFEANGAVPLWLLSNQDLLQDINFIKS